MADTPEIIYNMEKKIAELEERIIELEKHIEYERTLAMERSER